MKRTSVLMCSVLALQIVPVGAAQNAMGAAKVSERSLRQMATSAPKPEYPAASLKAKVAGVAVARVVVDTDGKPAAEILEAPDEHLAAAVTNAVARWTFKPLTRDGTSYPFLAKLTFYFRLENGKGGVLNPDEMPGGPAKRTTVPAAPGTKPPPPTRTPGIFTPDDVVVAAMTYDEFSKLKGDARPLILDIGERAAFKRGHQHGAINIPLDEMMVRAPIELRGQKFVVIDCTQEQMDLCRMAAHYLEDADIDRVAVLQR
jgi:TonB family protein